MNKILNLHRMNTENIGDLMCAPSIYYPELLGDLRQEILGFRQADEPSKTKRKENIDNFKKSEVIIVGGGGLLEIEFFSAFFRYVKENRQKNQKLVIWGAGHNAWEVADWRKIKRQFSFERGLFDLIGVRDHGHPGLNWVPCVSCMHPVFERRYPTKRAVGVYAHAGTIANEAFRRRLPVDIDMIDNSSPFEEAIEFLSGCELVLTDSFHGAYWSTLLGRRVVAFPTSSKFYDMKHAVPLCAPEDWERTAKLSRQYDEALKECRAATEEFKNKVMELIIS